LEAKEASGRKVVVFLDSITDPHNVGAILRSCDQFGASLVVMPSRHSASDFSDNEIIARSSAGASAYVPVAIVPNLVRAAQSLKEAGFWLYGADAGGESVQKVSFADKSVIVMGSEGSGIAKLLEEQCDTIVSIPTCGKIDSLNVSVAAGILLYESYRQKL
jgi:23S rRNA (guanosine2251-2'-O)-methyltransferase